MKLFFLPFVREGLRATASGQVRPRVDLALSLSSPGRAARALHRTFELLGPGDVLGLDPAQVLRVSPAAGARSAEVEMFPAIELDDPDLPWAYSPTPPAGARGLPWLCLVVVEAQPGVSVERGERGQSPFVLSLPREAAARELPPLAESWAWAHAQVTCATPQEIEPTLRDHPDRTLARLLSPRRLAPLRSYHACVVPTFRGGRAAGLGEDPGSTLDPAWSAADLPARLPVYYTWSFTTGEAGDFESLARRMRPAPLDASLPAPPLALSISGTVDFEPPFRVRGSRPERERAPADAVATIRAALDVGAADPPVLGPPYFGEAWSAERAFAPMTSWAPELNLTPMRRAAAGLGAEIVRREQDALVAAAEAQLEEFRERQRQGRNQRLAVALVNRINVRLARAPAAEKARVLAPSLLQGLRADLGLYSIAGRRMTRKLSAVQARGAARRIARGPAGPVHADPTLLAELSYAGEVLPARVSTGDLPLAVVDPGTVSEGAFAPRFDRPLLEPLAEHYRALVLPALGEIPDDAALLVEADPAFIEAYLVGANEELNRELLWRGLQAERRATPFRRFFPRSDGRDDIDALDTWTRTSALGSHLRSPPSLVLLLRGELIRRYPSLVLAAAPARWKTDRTREPDPTRSTVLPIFRGRVGEDVLYAGFMSPSIPEATGAREPSGPAGWFFLLAENPVDPRFGLDPEASGPPTRNTLAWTHLSSTALYAAVSAFPAVPDAGFTPAAATSAALATLLRQRPFRAFLHASTLIDTGS